MSKSIKAVKEMKHNMAYFSAFITIGNNIKNKKAEVCTYLITNINPLSKRFGFNKEALENRFNCSVETINKSLALLNSLPEFSVSNNAISMINNKKRGLKNE